MISGEIQHLEIQNVSEHKGFKIENLILIHVNKYQSPVFGHLKTKNHTIR